ncbi:18812_t:CDS:2 [Rhizophagus irregularis]|nr:18812_t:CDS:2 [Rhizophagus irregularis]
MSCEDNLQHVPTTFTWSQWGNHICIAGSFDPPNPVWTPIDMNKNADNVNEVTLSLVPDKKYFYKFVIDDQWVLDPTIPSYPDESGNYNHVIEVEPPSPSPLPSVEEKMIEDQKDEVQLPPPLPSEDEKMTEDQKDEVPLPPSIPSEEEKITEDQKDEIPFPPHIPSEEEKITEDQNDEVSLPPPIPSEEEKMAEDQKDDEEQKVENLESEIHQKEHYYENQVVNDDQELNQNMEEQVEVDIQKEDQELNQNVEEQVEVAIQKEDQELNQNSEEQVEVAIQKEDEELNQNSEEQVEVAIQKDQHQLEENQVQLQQGGKQILSEVQIEQNQHEGSQVSINNDQKEHYQHFDDQVTATADDQKEQHPHDDDQIVHQHEEVSKKTELFVDEVHVESDVTEKITESSTESSEAVQIDQSRDNSLVSEVLEIETTSIMKETIIESDNEKLSAEHVANNESIEKTPNIVETIKESQYTSSTSHDDSTNPVTFIEKEINISGEVTSEQTKEEMVSSNQDEGISSITTITQETPDSETSDVNVEGLSNEVIIVQSVVKDESINEFTEQSIIKDESINEFTEQSISKDESINEFTEQSVIKDESINEFTEQSVIKDELINEFTEQSVIKDDSINEFTEQSVVKDDDSINKFTEQSVVFEDESKVTEFIEDKPPSIDEKHEQNVSPSSVKISDSTTNATEIIMPSADTYPEGVSAESIKEVILNHTWAKDESIDETIPSTWLESYESTAYVWSENTQVEWSNKDTWALIEENTGTPKSEHVIEKIYSSNEVTESQEILSTSLVEETVTEQEGIPSSTNVNENLESTLVREVPAQSTNNESHMEDKTREIIVEEKAKEYDIMSGEKLVIKENINSTTEVKVIAEPSSVQYEKPESSATADEKVSSMPTTVIAPANDQDLINADVLKAIEKLKLIEKQENSEESLTGVNISAGKISQRKISPISPNASSPGESTRNADMYTTHNITVATNASREIVSPTKESLSIKSKSKKKPPIEITSREVLQKDLKSVQQHDDLNKLDFNIVYLVTTVATTFTLGIISMLYKSVFGQKRNR